MLMRTATKILGAASQWWFNLPVKPPLLIGGGKVSVNRRMLIRQGLTANCFQFLDIPLVFGFAAEGGGPPKVPSRRHDLSSA